jgi:hypothetical protein
MVQNQGQGAMLQAQAEKKMISGVREKFGPPKKVMRENLKTLTLKKYMCYFCEHCATTLNELGMHIQTNHFKNTKLHNVENPHIQYNNMTETPNSSAGGSCSNEISTHAINLVSESPSNKLALSWPPTKGSMIATLFEEGFYIGKVIGSITKNGLVRVNYMTRYLTNTDQGKNDHNKFWIWPSKEEPHLTSEHSVFGQDLEIEPRGHITATSMPGKNRVYVLKDHVTWSTLASESKHVTDNDIY